jgi:hypothetical protein
MIKRGRRPKYFSNGIAANAPKKLKVLIIAVDWLGIGN